MEESTQTKKEGKGINMTVAFVFVLILLIAAIGYIYINFKNTATQEELDLGDNVQTQESVVEDTEKYNTEEVASTDSSDTGTVVESDNGEPKANIDEDLKSFDSLNLSGIEDDYREGRVSDLDD